MPEPVILLIAIIVALLTLSLYTQLPRQAV